MSVANIARPSVVCIDKQCSVRKAAKIMRQEHVGSLVVVEQEPTQRRPLGIVTDRDLVMEIDAPDIDPASVTVGDIMSSNLITVDESEDVFRAIGNMRVHKVRRLPVVNKAQEVVGILSVDDILDTLTSALSDVVWLIRNEREQEQEQRS